MWIGRGLWFNLGFYQHFQERVRRGLRLVDVPRDRRRRLPPLRRARRCARSPPGSRRSPTCSACRAGPTSGTCKEAQPHGVDGVVHLVTRRVAQQLLHDAGARGRRHPRARDRREQRRRPRLGRARVRRASRRSSRRAWRAGERQRLRPVDRPAEHLGLAGPLERRRPREQLLERDPELRAAPPRAPAHLCGPCPKARCGFGRAVRAGTSRARRRRSGSRLADGSTSAAISPSRIVRPADLDVVRGGAGEALVRRVEPQQLLERGAGISDGSARSAACSSGSRARWSTALASSAVGATWAAISSCRRLPATNSSSSGSPSTRTASSALDA